MTELEKCMAGEDYNCHDEIFLECRNTMRLHMSRKRKKKKF